MTKFTDREISAILALRDHRKAEQAEAEEASRLAREQRLQHVPDKLFIEESNSRVKRSDVIDHFAIKMGMGMTIELEKRIEKLFKQYPLLVPEDLRGIERVFSPIKIKAITDKVLESL